MPPATEMVTGFMPSFGTTLADVLKFTEILSAKIYSFQNEMCRAYNSIVYLYSNH